jgi:hypothetical protein
VSYLAFPEPPDVPEEQIGAGRSPLRFEDVAQDGRVRIEGVWPAIGPILWGKLPVAKALGRLGVQGVRTVLTYVVIEGGNEPVSVRNLCEHSARWQVGHTVDDKGEINRLLFNTWLSSTAPRGVPGNPAVPGSGESVLVARAFGQHVLTKPRAEKGSHRVLRLEDPDLPEVPPTQLPFRDPVALLALPDGAEALDPGPRPDLSPIVFGLCHTDGNQHVNFLSYPRLAEEAGVRRLHELGHGARHLARNAEIGYRKPSFAGDEVHFVLQAFKLGEMFGIVGAFFEGRPGAAPLSSWADAGSPRAVVRLGFLAGK